MGVFPLEPSPLDRNLLENRGLHCSPACAGPGERPGVGGRAKRFNSTSGLLSPWMAQRGFRPVSSLLPPFPHYPEETLSITDSVK